MNVEWDIKVLRKGPCFLSTPGTHNLLLLLENVNDFSRHSDSDSNNNTLDGRKGSAQTLPEASRLLSEF